MFLQRCIEHSSVNCHEHKENIYSLQGLLLVPSIHVIQYNIGVMQSFCNMLQKVIVRIKAEMLLWIRHSSLLPQKIANEWMDIKLCLRLQGAECWQTHVHSVLVLCEPGIKAIHCIHICFQCCMWYSSIKKFKSYDRKLQVQDVWSNLHYASYLLCISCCIWSVHNNA